MKKHVLISCVKTKLDRPAKAKYLYMSSLFRMGYGYAKSLKPDNIFILSAKHGLISDKEVIKPYNVTLNNMKAADRRKWSERVLVELGRKADLQNDLFVFLAGIKYREYLLPHVRNHQIPMEGMDLFEQLAWLKERSKTWMCTKIHEIFNNLKRFSFPFNAKKIPNNGIYVLFEKKERGHGLDRIVRVGTHTGEKRLRSRLKEHFPKENKDRSIFRKNVGRVILSKAGDPFPQQWELDLTSSENKQKYSSQVDFSKLKKAEKQVSDVIQKNFSFVVFEVPDKERRLEIESKLISTVSLCDVCVPSSHWLGSQSPEERIRESGLWQEKHLYKSPLLEEDYRSICKMVGQS